MNHPYTGDQDAAATVVGFEVPKSPDSSYNNVYVIGGGDDDGREPPAVPPHLYRTLLNLPVNRDTTTNTGSHSLPLPQNVTLNHLYIDNREMAGAPPCSVVGLGMTHRFRSKYVTVVLYKPVHQRGC